MKEIRIAVTGGRSFDSKEQVAKVLCRLQGRNVILAHGGATGADDLCKQYAVKMGWKVVEYKAQWSLYGKRAGPIRNAWLLDNFKPDYLIAFSGGTGTFDMINKALDRKIRIVYALQVK